MRKILIADDDPDIGAILKLMLQMKGYQVENATNSTDVLVYADNKPDLILLDLSIAGHDGREIFTRLRQQHQTKDIPVIFMSANSRLKEIAREYAVDDFIEKPFEIQDMLTKINQLFEK